MEEIEDEAETDKIKEDRKRVKDKLYLLFSDHQAGKVLNDAELFVISEYLQKHVAPFSTSRMRKQVLNDLIYNGEVVEITSDDVPYIHNLDKTEDSRIVEDLKEANE